MSSCQSICERNQRWDYLTIQTQADFHYPDLRIVILCREFLFSNLDYRDNSVTVITSYSIHYTKLYERILGWFWESLSTGFCSFCLQETFNDTVKKRNNRYFINFIVLLFWRTICYLIFKFMPIALRITSYNVCYTKLLRIIWISLFIDSKFLFAI